MNSELTSEHLEFGIFEYAILELKKLFKQYDTSYYQTYDYHPIETIKHRIKSIDGIAKKLAKKNHPCTYDSALNHLTDVAGIRVICPFVENIQQIVDFIAEHSEIEIVTTKDYISQPKANGYRSFHMILKVPISFHTYVEQVCVELQIRTIAMDFWATLEHQMAYKSVFSNNIQLMSQELQEYSELLHIIDQRMQSLKLELE